jgi:hypothetical protein
MSKRKTQGRAIIEALKRRPLTYLEMIQLGQGLSPWKRVKESLHENEQVLVTDMYDDGLVRWQVLTNAPKYAVQWPAFRPPKEVR